MVESYFLTSIIPMPKLIKITALACSLLISSFVQAEEATIDSGFFVGTWELVTAGPKLKVETKKSDTRLKKTPYSYLAGSGNKSFDETWKFYADGKFELTAKDHRASGMITTGSTYIVENNQLKIAKVGRPGKYYSYKVHSKEGDQLIIRGGLEGYYTFKKK